MTENYFVQATTVLSYVLALLILTGVINACIRVLCYPDGTIEIRSFKKFLKIFVVFSIIITIILISITINFGSEWPWQLRDFMIAVNIYMFLMIMFISSGITSLQRRISNERLRYNTRLRVVSSSQRNRSTSYHQRPPTPPMPYAVVMADSEWKDAQELPTYEEAISSDKPELHM